MKFLTYFSCDFDNIIVRGIQDISRFFDCSSKKRDLSNNSNDGEASKKPTKGSLTFLKVFDLFTESLNDPECFTILLNWMKK